jgi:hypothetical protein
MSRSILARTVRRALALTALGTASLSAQTFGNPLVARPIVDTFTSFVTIALGSPFLPTGAGSLQSFSVFGGITVGAAQTNVGATIAPLLFRNIASVWTVVGVGTTRTVQNGINTWDFGLTSGSADVTTETRFGWWSGGGSGAVHYTDLVGPTMGFSSSNAFPIVPGSGTGLNVTFSSPRTYSISFLVGQPSTVVPEPSTYVLMATGLAAIAAVRVRRRARVS